MPKLSLINKLIDSNAFWSYKIKVKESIPDEIIIEKTLIHLDLEDIKTLFTLYPYQKIKNVWRNNLIPQDEQLHTLNLFLAWMYFSVKNPKAYIKTRLTQHYNHLQCLH